MSAKPVFRRRQAIRDAEQATIYYAREAGLDVATRFVAALEATIRTIADRPGTASAIWGERLGIPGLRSRPVTGFPYFVFYVEQKHHVEVRRVLHAKRDIPASLDEPDDAG